MTDRRTMTRMSAVAAAALIAVGGCTASTEATGGSGSSSALTSESTTRSAGPSTSAAGESAAPESAAGASSSASAVESSAPSETSASSEPAETSPVQPSGDPVTVVDGLAAPWSTVFVDGAALVSERDTGRILQVDGATTREVGVVEGTVHQGEGGLLGLAVLTGATTYLYAYFTAGDDNRIVRYPLTGDAAAFSLGPVEPVFSGIAKAGNHNGGRIAFGPDGMLYVTAGDAGERDSAQDQDSLNGKILRLTPEGALPADNPIAGLPMYSMGHRNPQGIAWDASGRLWAAEFGQNTWDELNLIEPGANYGWPVVEGVSDDPRFVNPVQQWPTDEASPSGITVAGGTVFIANLRGERLRAVPIAEPAASSEYFVGGYGRLRDVAIAPDGALWLLTNNTDGRGDPRDGDDRILRVPLTAAS